jgi:hypothetical protein
LAAVKKPVYASSEDAEQEAVVEYCDLLHIPIVHIPNEGKRSLSYAARMKRMGLRSGFPDLLVPLARGGYHGLFIEMKYGKNKTTKEQKEWLERLSAEGYACAVCYNAAEAIKTIESYNRRKP